MGIVDQFPFVVSPAVIGFFVVTRNNEIAGEDFGVVLREVIFEPLGMSESFR